MNAFLRAKSSKFPVFFPLSREFRQRGVSARLRALPCNLKQRNPPRHQAPPVQRTKQQSTALSSTVSVSVNMFSKKLEQRLVKLCRLLDLRNVAAVLEHEQLGSSYAITKFLSASQRD